jgi:hypothetical protein
MVTSRRTNADNSTIGPPARGKEVGIKVKTKKGAKPKTKPPKRPQPKSEPQPQRA